MFHVKISVMNPDFSPEICYVKYKFSYFKLDSLRKCREWGGQTAVQNLNSHKSEKLGN